jgi:hypothetical protein
MSQEHKIHIDDTKFLLSRQVPIFTLIIHIDDTGIYNHVDDTDTYTVLESYELRTP